MTISVLAVDLSINYNISTEMLQVREVMHMSDYEMLSVLLTIGILIVSIIALCLKAKK